MTNSQTQRTSQVYAIAITVASVCLGTSNITNTSYAGETIASPSMSIANAKEIGRYIATATLTPSSFTLNSKRIQVVEAWIEKNTALSGSTYFFGLVTEEKVIPGERLVLRLEGDPEPCVTLSDYLVRDSDTRAYLGSIKSTTSAGSPTCFYYRSFVPIAPTNLRIQIESRDRREIRATLEVSVSSRSSADKTSAVSSRDSNNCRYTRVAKGTGLLWCHRHKKSFRSP